VTTTDYIVVGSGISGATVARVLKDAGKEVLVLEAKNRVAGNCYDELHSSGQRFNLHGPHYFRTSSDVLWEFAQRFSEFRPFRAILKSKIGDTYYPYPVTEEMIAEMTGESWYTDPYAGTPDFEGEILAKIPRAVYEKFVKGYTERQWGVPAKSLSASLASRVEIRTNDKPELSTKKYQGIPVDGYTQWIANMLDGIPVELGVNYLQSKEKYTARKKVVFTGAIDAYFEYKFGKLEHRSQARIHTYYPEVNQMLPVCQVNYPSLGDKIIREVEWKHIFPSDAQGTLITQETPVWGGDEYPFPSRKNELLYAAYKKWADELKDVVFVGRLAENKYLDMDQAMGRALLIGDRLCEM